MEKIKNPFDGMSKANRDYWSKLLFKQKVDQMRECGWIPYEAEKKAREEVDQLLREADGK